MNAAKNDYESLESALNQKPWPQDYLFKFIVKSDQKETIETIKSFFKDYNPAIKLNPSKKGTYTSISIEATMKDAKTVIQQYKKVGTLKEVMML